MEIKDSTWKLELTLPEEQSASANGGGGNSIVYRNHKVCDGLASLYDGVPSYIVLLK